MRLVFAGVLDETNHPESRAYFKQKIEPKIDGDQIQFLGPADLKLKNELLGNATAFLNPISWAEPFGMVAIESMATGTPVISFAKGGPTEIIEHGKSGLLVHSTDEMAAAVNLVSEIDRGSCRQVIETKFSSPVMTAHYVKLYREAIALQATVKAPLSSGQGRLDSRLYVKVPSKRRK